MYMYMYIDVYMYIHIQNPHLYAQAQADSMRKTHFSTSKRKIKREKKKSSRRSADVVRRVPRGGWEEYDINPLHVTHAHTHARTHALTHLHRRFVCCQSPIAKALSSASCRSIRQRTLTCADVCCCQSPIVKALPSASYLTKPLCCYLNLYAGN